MEKILNSLEVLYNTLPILKLYFNLLNFEDALEQVLTYLNRLNPY